MGDTLKIGLMCSGIGLILVAGISFVLSWFIALKSSPSRRAAWTAGLAYILATIFLLSMELEDYEWAMPLLALPGALVAFCYWRMTFRRAWVGNPEDLPEGMTIEDDDWRVGLLELLAAIVLVKAVLLVRWAVRGF